MKQGCWVLKKEFRFDAAHQLVGHDGKCARLHGHSWVGRVIVAGNELETVGPKAGMLLDYSALKAAVAPLVEEYLDHHFLNATLLTERPTSEFVARWLFDKLRPVLGTHLIAVEIDETCTSSCRYEVRSEL